MKIKKETGKSLKEAMQAAKKVYKKGTSSKKTVRKTKKTKKTKRRITRKARKGKSKRRRC